MGEIVKQPRHLEIRTHASPKGPRFTWYCTTCGAEGQHRPSPRIESVIEFGTIHAMLCANVWGVETTYEVVGYESSEGK